MTTIGLSYSLVKISTKCAPALIELRGYDLRRFNQNLSVFMAEYEEYLDSDGTREPPKLVLH